jgi:hypothetical protein
MNLGKDSLAIEGRTTPTMAIVTYGFNNDHPNYDCLPPPPPQAGTSYLPTAYFFLTPPFSA